jgi:hypothetical protein
MDHQIPGYEVGVIEFMCYSPFFKFETLSEVNLALLPFSDVIGVGKINSRINPHYHHPRNKLCFWILTGVPVYCGSRKVSKQSCPWPCYLKKYFSK